MANVWTGLVEGILAFGQTRVANLLGSSFQNTGSFVGALAEDRAITPNVKSKFEQLKDDVENGVAAVQPIVEKVEPKISAAADAAGKMATELETTPFTMGAPTRAATELAFVLIAVDEALLILAEELSKDAEGNVQPAIKTAIEGISEPWKKPFRDLGAGAGGAFDDVANQLLGIDNASRSFADRVSFDRAGKELRLEFARSGRRELGALALEDVILVGFLNYKEKAVVGVRLRTKLEAGLRSDKLLEKTIPGGNNPRAESTMIQLDSDDGLTFGEGKNRRLTLPVNFSVPGLELREFMIGLPSADQPGSQDSVEIMATLATKFGEAVGLVVEGTGVQIRWNQGGGNRLAVSPRLPTGLGVRIDAGIVAGGGFILRDDKEYSGILDLKIGEFRITAIAILVTDPLSFVVILAIRFSPAIQLGFGFTLNGLGGILAVERRVAVDPLRAGIADGTAATILFPENPIDAAKTILTKVRDIFPAQEGSFAVGPIGELGWGGEAGFVVAKIGIVLSLPDPLLVLLGSVKVGVPSPKAKPRIVDLQAEVYGEFTPEHMLVIVGLVNSKIANISVSGDIGIYVRWAGAGDFALSVGGFFPGYEPPKALASLRVISVDLSPASWLSLRAEGYFAITANSLQFGAAIRLNAKLGPVRGKAWLTLDALFRWSPRFYFEVRLTAGISLSVAGVDVFGVDFRGSLQGTSPWRIQGYASVRVLLWTIEFDLGPHTWGARDTSELPTVSPRALVAQALSEDKAWAPEVPDGADEMVHLLPDTTTPLLVHPLGGLEVKQLKVPLETKVDRVGRAKVSETRIHLEAPHASGASASVVSHSTDRFAPGQFLKLSDEQQISRPAFESMPSGMRVAPSASHCFGPTSSVAYEWETAFPQEPGRSRRSDLFQFSELMVKSALKCSVVAKAMRLRGNPYVAKTEPLELRDAEERWVGRADDLSATPADDRYVTYTHAAERIEALIEPDSVVVPGAVEVHHELLAAGVGS
jgi:hypothetical protein